MTRMAVWHGTEQEALVFKIAIEHNCECATSATGQRSGSCASHQSQLDQRFLDGLVFCAWMAERLILEEMG